MEDPNDSLKRDHDADDDGEQKKSKKPKKDDDEDSDEKPGKNDNEEDDGDDDDDDKEDNNPLLDALREFPRNGPKHYVLLRAFTKSSWWRCIASYRRTQYGRVPGNCRRLQISSFLCEISRKQGRHGRPIG